MTSNRPVLPYRSTTSRTERRPSLQRVCTWKSHKRNGSYPGTSGPHVQMIPIGWSMVQDFRPEIPNIEIEHRTLAHCAIPSRRGPHPAITRHFDPSERCEPPAEIRVLAMKLDGPIEAADRFQSPRSNGEISAVKNRAQPETVVYQHVCGRRHQMVVQSN